MRLEFDPESKLLVSMRQWENAEWKDPPSHVAEKITYYESLPDDLFQYEIPPGVTCRGAIEHRHSSLLVGPRRRRRFWQQRAAFFL